MTGKLAAKKADRDNAVDGTSNDHARAGTGGGMGGKPTRKTETARSETRKVSRMGSEGTIHGKILNLQY